VASTAPGQPITVGGQKIKPGQPGYDQLAKATLKELQAPGGCSQSCRGKHLEIAQMASTEAYLTAFVQKNLLAGIGALEAWLINKKLPMLSKQLPRQPMLILPNKDPLWNDLARAAALAAPAAGALTGRDPKASKDPNTPGATAPGAEPAAGEKPAATAEPAKPTMTKAQISQWISRNSEDPTALKAALDAINAVKV
jgi:hypothetical protein